MITAAALRVTVGAEIRDALSGLRRVNGAVSGTAGFFRQAAASAVGFTAATLGLSALGGIASAVNSAIFGMNNTLQGAEIALTTLLGSADAARTHLAALTQFAKTTPFDLPQLLEANQRLLAYGFAVGDVIPLLNDMGNVAAGLNVGQDGINRMTRALGQMKNAGRVLQEDLNQLQDLGVNTGAVFAVMARQTGKTVPQLKKLQAAGKLDSKQFLAAFQTWSRENFGGMMAAQSRTMVGALSNIRDALGIAGAQAFQPIFTALQTLALRFAQFTETDEFATWVARVRSWSQTAVTWLQTNIPRAIDTAIASWATLQTTIAGVEGWMAGTLVPTFQRVVAFLTPGFTSALAPVQAAWLALQPTLTAAAAQFSALWTNVLVPVATWLANHMGPILAGVGVALAGAFAPAVFAGAAALVGLFGALVSPLVLLGLAVAGLGLLWQHNWGGIQEKTASVVSFLTGLFSAAQAKMAEFRAAVERLVYDLTLKLAPFFRLIGKVASFDVVGASIELGKILAGGVARPTPATLPGAATFAPSGVPTTVDNSVNISIDTIETPEAGRATVEAALAAQAEEANSADADLVVAR